jgi:hypothetical protein
MPSELTMLDSILAAKLKTAATQDAILSVALRIGRTVFRANQSYVARKCEMGRLEFSRLHPQSVTKNTELILAFLKGQRPIVPPDTSLVAIRRRGEIWASAVFTASDTCKIRARRAIPELERAIARAFDRIDRERVSAAYSRLETTLWAFRKTPKVFLYSFLHAVQRFIRYDHSAALLLPNESTLSLSIAVEQLEWTRKKSQDVGICRVVGPECLSYLKSGVPTFFDRINETWEPRDVNAPLALLSSMHGSSNGEPTDRRPRCTLLVPIVDDGMLLSVLRISTSSPHALRLEHVELLRRFRAHLFVGSIRLIEEMENAGPRTSSLLIRAATDLQEALTSARTATDASTRGKLLEDFALRFISECRGVVPLTGRARTRTQELDLTVQVTGPQEFHLYGAFFCVECKNFATAADHTDLTPFVEKLRDRRCTFGLFIAPGGVTPSLRDRVKTCLRDGIVIAVLDMTIIEALKRHEQPSAILKTAYYQTRIYAGEPGSKIVVAD